MIPQASAKRPAVLGVDVGGTFTDAVLVVDDRIFTAKQPTSDPQTSGVLAAAATVLAAADVRPDEVVRFVHGMTVATNALLERRGARVVLVTTEGFGDLLAVARQDRAGLYTLYPTRQPPLVPRDRCLTVEERMGPDGVERPLRPDEVARVVTAVRDSEPEAVAVCLLWSHLVGSHEELLGDALRRGLSGVPVFTSLETAPVFREYERMSTVVVDAYLSTRTAGYLRLLAEGCRAAGLPAPEIMQSSGGTTDIDTAAAHAVRLLLSGPAGGAVAARTRGTRLGSAGVGRWDWGGTSTDGAALSGDEAAGGRAAAGTTTERSLTGLPVRTPMIDVHTVSAGGGSVGWVDAGGALKVGPGSAGSDPGPACYGHGGVEATVTDALVVLGRIPRGAALAGTLHPDRRLARQAVARLGAQVGLGVEETAEGIVRVATAGMAAALRAVTLERGLDPRGFLLVAFGGAGPLHACELADELGMPHVMVPLRAGVLSALGLSGAPRRADLSRSLLRVASSIGGEEWERAWVALEDEVVARNPAVAVGPGRVRRRREVEARYRGQSHELTLSVDPGGGPESAAAAFHGEHERMYGYRDLLADVEIVTLRAVAERPEGPGIPADPPPRLIARGRARVYLQGRGRACPVWQVSPENGECATVAGPAVVAADEFCCLVAPGWIAEPVPDGFMLGRARVGDEPVRGRTGA